MRQNGSYQINAGKAESTGHKPAARPGCRKGTRVSGEIWEGPAISAGKGTEQASDLVTFSAIVTRPAGQA